MFKGSYLDLCSTYKNIKLDQMIHLNVIFHEVVSNYRLVKFETRRSFLLDLERAYYFSKLERVFTHVINEHVFQPKQKKTLALK